VRGAHLADLNYILLLLYIIAITPSLHLLLHIVEEEIGTP
jgi:hypothetical protein